MIEACWINSIEIVIGKMLPEAINAEVDNFIDQHRNPAASTLGVWTSRTALSEHARSFLADCPLQVEPIRVDLITLYRSARIISTSLENKPTLAQNRQEERRWGSDT